MLTTYRNQEIVMAELHIVKDTGLALVRLNKNFRNNMKGEVCGIEPKAALYLVEHGDAEALPAPAAPAAARR